MKDRLWSIDLFRCESATLRSHWVLVVMDQYTRRIIGFGVHAGKVDGVGLCRMFNRAIREQRWMPKYLSSDNDPLYRFHQWQALKDNFQDRGDCQNTRTSATTFVSQNPVRFAIRELLCKCKKRFECRRNLPILVEGPPSGPRALPFW